MSPQDSHFVKWGMTLNICILLNLIHGHEQRNIRKFVSMYVLLELPICGPTYNTMIYNQTRRKTGFRSKSLNMRLNFHTHIGIRSWFGGVVDMKLDLHIQRATLVSFGFAYNVAHALDVPTAAANQRCGINTKTEPLS